MAMCGSRSEQSHGNQSNLVPAEMSMQLTGNFD
jgi:hypothetical protein